MARSRAVGGLSLSVTPSEVTGAYLPTGNPFVLERGYELEYTWLAESIQEPMSVEECEEVYDILEMDSDLLFAHEQLGEASGVDKAAVAFRGFDGNEEARTLSYAPFLIEDLGKWTDLATATCQSSTAAPTSDPV
jgi:uncharacterized protein YfbU (UPF0304 family)